MAISGINGSVNYGQIASGKKINSAADDASGLTIAKKLESQSKGLEVGASNAKDGIGVTNIADQALSSIGDSLQRIKELGIQAKNTAVYSPSDIGAMQDEVNELLGHIEQVAVGTEYNTMKLLDGNMADMDMATNPDGSGMSIKMQSSTLASLGIEGFDLTQDFDLDAIDKAIEKVSSSRSSLGASANGLEAAYSYGKNSAIQTTGALSKTEDLDMAKAVSEQKKNKVLDDYKTLAQKQKMNADQGILNLFK